MAFIDIEKSIAAGRPARLYLFELDSVSWAFTSADRLIRFGARDYHPAALTDDGIRLTGEASADTLTLTVPADLAPALRFAGHPPASEMFLTIRDTHYGLPDAPENALVVWIGTVVSIRWTRPGTAEMVCENLSASMARPALRLNYERNCPHALFDTDCRTGRAAWRIDAEVTDVVDGLRVKLSTCNPDVSYAGGYIEWFSSDGTANRRAIEAQNGVDFDLLSGTQGIAAGLRVALYPGCDGSRATCNGIFGNLDNYGGFAHMPGESPFENNQFF
ncbi:MAG: phage BR0599 family protein [Zoogloeaceae bacterium]|jgi:uncharacterized phage protein (TIGR02218 family)|nr:phage BR0599 family protein [Zoogloeaceae bacterium]